MLTFGHPHKDLSSRDQKYLRLCSLIPIPRFHKKLPFSGIWPYARALPTDVHNFAKKIIHDNPLRTLKALDLETIWRSGLVSEYLVNMFGRSIDKVHLDSKTASTTIATSDFYMS